MMVPILKEVACGEKEGMLSPGVWSLVNALRTFLGKQEDVVGSFTLDKHQLV